jgi:hypothetical protein
MTIEIKKETLDIKAKVRFSDPEDPRENKWKIKVEFNQFLYLMDEVKPSGFLFQDFQTEYSAIFRKRSQEKIDKKYIAAVEKDINALLQKYRKMKRLFVSDEVKIKMGPSYPFNLAMGITVIDRGMVRCEL